MLSKIPDRVSEFKLNLISKNIKKNIPGTPQSQTF